MPLPTIYALRDRAKLYSTGKTTVENLIRQFGVVVELDAGRLKVWNATLGDDGEFLEVPDAAFDLLADHRDAVREYLTEEAYTLKKFQEAWWFHDTGGYRDYCRQCWARDGNY